MNINYSLWSIVKLTRQLNRTQKLTTPQHKTHKTHNPANMSSPAPFPSSTCRGGASYEKPSCVVRVKEEFCSNPEETEALLVKNTGVANLDEITIRGMNGKTYNSLSAYITGNATMAPDGWSLERQSQTFPWVHVEVLVGTYWEAGNIFYSRCQPSTDCPDPLPPLSPEPLPRGGLSFTKGTFNIRSAFQKDPTAPSTPRTAKMIVDTIDNVRIVEWWTSYSYASLGDWIFARHVDPKRKDYSPWEMIDIEVDGKWITGTTFRALSQPATPENTGPVPRS